MKVVFEKQVLIAALTAASGSVSSKSTQNATEGFLIESDGDGSCIIASYDTEKGMRLSVPCRVFDEGSCVIKADRFMSMVKVLPGDVTLDVNNKCVATVSSGKSFFEINAINGEQFPALPDLSVENGFTIKQGELKKMILSTMFAVGAGDPRPELNGEFFTISHGEITLVSCDSNRLAIKTKKCEMSGLGDSEYKFIIPVRSLGELVKLLGEEELVTIRPSRKHVVFKIGDKTFFTKLIDKDYIDYNRYIPKVSSIFVEVDRDALLDSLSRALVATEDKEAGKTKPPIRCRFSNNVLYLSSKSVSGTFSEEMPTSHEGDDILIGFNCRYLVDAIQACDCARIELAMSSPLMTMIVTSADKDEKGSFTYLVLPTKLKD